MTPSVSTEFPPPQSDLKEKNVQEIVKIEVQLEEVKFSVNLEENLPLRLTTLRGCDEDGHQFDSQSSLTNSQLESPSKKGALFGTLAFFYLNMTILWQLYACLEALVKFEKIYFSIFVCLGCACFKA